MGCSIQEHKETISNQSLRLEASHSNLERDLSSTQFPNDITVPGCFNQISGNILRRVGLFDVLVGRS